MLQKLINRRNHERDAAKDSGHGDHWRCVYPDPRSDGLVAAIEKLVSRTSPAHERAGVAQYISSGAAVRMCVLARRNIVVTAYPQVLGGPEWPVEIAEIVPWRNGLEGQIVGTCMGAEVRFFDTTFYANRHRYTIGKTYRFRMGALAHRLGPANDLEAEVEGGAKVSLKGAHAYMPANLGVSGAEIDDYWFHSPLAGPTTVTEINGVELRGYPITLALPRDFEMSLTLYAASHTEGPGAGDLAPNDDLQGYLWLQGYLE